MGRPSNTEERQEQIARALIDVMAERGYERASINRIAERAGLTGGLVHYHFKNKREILIRATGMLTRDHEERLKSFVEQQSSAPEALDAFLRFHLSLDDGAPELLAAWLVVCAEAMRDERVRQEFRGAVIAIAAILREIIRQGIEEGTLRSEALDEEAASVIALVEGYYVVAAVSRDVVPEGSALRMARYLVEKLFHLV